jgi:hypothetical protein
MLNALTHPLPTPPPIHPISTISMQAIATIPSSPITPKPLSTKKPSQYAVEVPNQTRSTPPEVAQFIDAIIKDLANMADQAAEEAQSVSGSEVQDEGWKPKETAPFHQEVEEAHGEE